MALFDFAKVLLGRYPSADWQASPALVMEYDFDRQTLCGVRIGSLTERFKALGPAEDPAAAVRGMLDYPSKGVAISLEGDRGMDFTITWKDEINPEQNRAGAYLGSTKFRGQPLGLGLRTTEADLRKLFGPPTSRDADEDEIIVRHVIGGIAHDFELTNQGKLRVMIVIGEN